MFMLRRMAGVVCVLALGVCTHDSWAQVAIKQRVAATASASAPVSLRVDSSMVLVPVSVTDALNRPVMGLGKSNFRLFDNNVEQELVSLAFEDAPVAIALVFDTSKSMDRKTRKSRIAVAQFLRVANPGDEFCLIEFNDDVTLAQAWTSDPAEIMTRLDETVPRGRTALLDAIALGLQELKKSSQPRKAIVILSDGGDNRSRFTASELRSMVGESDALIYAMGIFEDGGAHLSIEEIAGPGLLDDITQVSGGRLYPVSDLNKLPDIAARIGVELHNQYLLAYRPASMQRDGRHHRVRVRVAPPEGIAALNVDWRAGYYAPVH